GMTRDGGPRQPGGGRQIAGPRAHDRGAAFAQRHRFAKRPKPASLQHKRPGPSHKPAETSAPKPAEPQAPATGVQTTKVTPDEADVLVLDKPMGLAVQGGSGTVRHLDGMLEALRDAKGQRPRLVHRLDKDTAGCLLVAKTRFAASALAKNFRSREARKIYWALVAGVPKPRQGRISTFLAKEELESDSRMRIVRHGEEGASHAV